MVEKTTSFIARSAIAALAAARRRARRVCDRVSANLDLAMLVDHGPRAEEQEIAANDQRLKSA
jgi:hypothetical protein